jgi:hypothetical protein
MPLEFVGWRPSMHERMWNRQYAYGLKPIGPWIAMAADLLSPRRVTCDRCDGEGLLTVDIDRWQNCPMCEGTGGLWTCPPWEVETLRKRILERFPEAEPSSEASDSTIELDRTPGPGASDGAAAADPMPTDLAAGIPRPRPSPEPRAEVARDPGARHKRAPAFVFVMVVVIGLAIAGGILAGAGCAASAGGGRTRLWAVSTDGLVLGVGAVDALQAVRTGSAVEDDRHESRVEAP